MRGMEFLFAHMAATCVLVVALSLRQIIPVVCNVASIVNLTIYTSVSHLYRTES